MEILGQGNRSEHAEVKGSLEFGGCRLALTTLPVVCCVRISVYSAGATLLNITI